VLSRHGIVEHHEHAPPGQQGPVARRPLVHSGRNAVGLHSERVQEPTQGIDRGHRLASAEPPEIDVELPVGEVGRPTVRPVHGERGLAHASATADRRDGQARLLAGRGGDPVQLRQLGPSSHEPGHGRRKLAGNPLARAGGRLGRRGAVRPTELLDPVPGGRQRSQLGARGAKDLNELIEPVGGRQGRTREVLPDDRVRPAGPRGQLPVGQRGPIPVTRLAST